MTIEIDHLIVPSRDKQRAASLLGSLLGVDWSPQGLGPFAPVYVNARLTIDFIDADEAFEVYHVCFRVGEAEFDAILARLQDAGIAWSSEVRGAVDKKINTGYGGRMVYWNEPDGHQWEMLTVSYARRPAA